MVMLDTDVVIAVLRGDETAIRQLRKHNDKGESLCISTVTVFELLRGVQRSQQPEKDRATYATATGTMYPIDFTYIEADIAAHIDAHLARAGKQVAIPDKMIAATCISIGMPLITRNTKHFENIPLLKLETW